MKKNPILLLIVATSFGEVDWILPVLSAFHEQNPDWRIITLFGHQIVYQGLQENKELHEEFAKISSLNIVPQEIDLLLENDISSDQVKIILKDFNQDEFAPYKSYIAEKCPNALLVSYPHSNYIYSNCTSEPVRVVADPDAYSKHDLFLLSSPHDIPYWSSFVDVGKIRTFGYPIFDKRWQEKLAQSPLFLQSEEMARAQKADKVFFHISRHPHPIYLADTDYQYLLKTMLETVFSYNDSLLIIKRHPRQDLESFLELLKPYDPSRWIFSGFHLTQLCRLADVAISFWASGILNALSVNTPVIEFYRFGKHNPDWRKLPDGSNTSIYRELCLAAPANTGEELRNQIDLALAQNDPVWELQQKAFQTHCLINENTSSAIVQCLLDEQVKKRTIQGLTHKSRRDPLEEQIDRAVALVDKGEMEKAHDYLKGLAGKYPSDHRVFNTLGVFLYNQGDFVAGADNLVKSLNLMPSYIDAAANLVQVLVELDRLDDAVEIVISFHANSPNSEIQNSFLWILKNQLSEKQFDIIHQEVGKIRDG